MAFWARQHHCIGKPGLAFRQGPPDYIQLATQMQMKNERTICTSCREPLSLVPSVPDSDADAEGVTTGL